MAAKKETYSGAMERLEKIVRQIDNNELDIDILGEKIKEAFPDNKDRLNHIFSKQVYGLAPTEVIYKIACNFVLGFSDDIHIEKHNLRLLDSLPSIQADNFEEDLIKLYPELKD